MVSQVPHPDDATPDERVATLLAAAAAPAEAGPQPGEEQVLAAFRAAPHRTRRIPMTSFPSSAHRARLAVAATIGAGTFLFAGVGAAAAGVLPDAAQDTASTVLGQLGFEVPRANDAAGDHPAQRGAEEDAEATETDTDVTETDETDTDTDETVADATATETADTEAEGSQGKGEEVSGLATTTDAEGADKGAEISTTASGGKSRAGAEHTAPEPATGADDADTADDADAAGDSDDAEVADDDAAEDNDGASASGTDTAGEASSGRIAAGSNDRP